MMIHVDPSTQPLQSIEDLPHAGIRVLRLSLSDQYRVCRSKELPLEVFASMQGGDFVAAIFELELAVNALETFGPTVGDPDLLIVARRETLTGSQGSRTLPGALWISPRTARSIGSRCMRCSSVWSHTPRVWGRCRS